MAAADQLSPGEWAVLGAVGEGATHGFAVSQLLGEDGMLGQIWTVPRPMVYQSLNKLLARGYVREVATEPSPRGPSRAIVTVTPAGRQALRRWLGSPVTHVRDVRSMLLLKLAFLHRAGRDPTRLLQAQRSNLIPNLAAITARRDAATGFDRVLLEWRLTSFQATVQFLDTVLATAAPPKKTE